MGEYQGRCFCGAVELTVTGEPAAMGYCHCSSCREWSAAPVNAFTLWKPSAVKVTKGEELLGTFARSERSYRQFCKRCGGHVMTSHPPPMDLVDVYAAVVPGLRFEPKLHINYQEKVLRIPDGLPKLRDVPAEMGGSGEALPE